VFGRRGSSDGVECRWRGDHAIASPRLRVVAARRPELVAALALSRDAQAQHWLGWAPEELLRSLGTRTVRNVLLLRDDLSEFVAYEARSGRLAANIGVRRRPDGEYEIGGVVDPDLRGRGYGREALAAVCRLLHGHFGILRLLAVCESSNAASRRWLSASDFVRTPGPEHHALPNGRVIESLWWEHTDPDARRRCRRPTGPGSRRSQRSLVM
jgi:RimJ/RimL family protein N-acetyltransferase